METWKPRSASLRSTKNARACTGRQSRNTARLTGLSWAVCGEFDAADGYDAVAFGCPFMGAEQLEEGILNLCLSPVRESSLEKRLRCLALTDRDALSGRKASGAALA